METIKFASDSSTVKISVRKGKVEISNGKSAIIPISKGEIREIRIAKRSKRYVPDKFFIAYAIFTEVIGIGALYFLFKTTKGEYFYYGVITFLIASVFYFLTMIKAANARQALFVKTARKTFEFPVNSPSDIEKIISFFQENGIPIYRKG